jgi:cell division protein ZapA
MSNANSIDVRIAGRQFTLACAPDERADLESAVAMVSERVDEAYAQASNSGTERLLLLAALNLAHDLRRLRNVRGGSAATVVASNADAELKILREKIEKHLSK